MFLQILHYEDVQPTNVHYNILQGDSYSEVRLQLNDRLIKTLKTNIHINLLVSTIALDCNIIIIIVFNIMIITLYNN